MAGKRRHLKKDDRQKEGAPAVTELQATSLERRVTELETALRYASEIARENAKRVGRIEERIEGESEQYRSLQAMMAANAKDLGRLKHIVEEVLQSMLEARLASEERQDRREAKLHEIIRTLMGPQEDVSDTPSDAGPPHGSG